MKRSVVETLLGATVLAVAGSFFAFAWHATDSGTPNGYPLIASFSKAGSLHVGSDVKISGIKVGAITDQVLDPQTWSAKITFSIAKNVKLPIDSIAAVQSDGLLGGSYLAIIPGNEEETLNAGEALQYTQAGADLMDLLGRFAFSGAKDATGAGAKEDTGAHDTTQPPQPSVQSPAQPSAQP